MVSSVSSGLAELDHATLPIPHIPRVFHKHPDSSYILPVDEQEAERLELQHKVFKGAFEGRLLLPPFKSNSGYAVLDSGVGTAAWLLDVASQLSPSAILHGIDIESTLFPRTRPLNMSFSVNSITALPGEWSNKFDFVHQRFLFSALKRTEWPQAMNQIFRVLKPSGWAQLGEYGDNYAGPINERHARLRRALFASRDLVVDVSDELPSLLRKAGFVNITVETRSVPLGAWAGQQGLEARDNLVSAFRAMKTPILKSGGFGFVESEEEFDRLIDALGKEWDETKGSEKKVRIVYAQRPAE
ncbi:hypothetical protein M0805_009486 [Coniferiporia weirii]|nr:hypothetical protein M0805_009486 [Coniferiporia weirii]